MKARTKKILEEALTLSVEELEVLVDSLEASLDQACAEELERRVHDLLERRSDGRPTAEVIAEVRAKLRALRQGGD